MFVRAVHSTLNNRVLQHRRRWPPEQARESKPEDRQVEHQPIRRLNGCLRKAGAHRQTYTELYFEEFLG